MDDYGEIFDDSIRDDYGMSRDGLKEYEYQEFKEGPLPQEPLGIALFESEDVEEEDDDRTEAEIALGIEREKPEEKKESAIQERLRKKALRQHKYTPKEMERFREEAKRTLVRDWGPKDPFHLSQEEKAELDTLDKIRADLNTVKLVPYRRPEDYIKAMRIVMEAWKIMAETNGIYSYDEFMKRVTRGEIISPAIPDVRLKHMERYSLDRLALFISNPEMNVNEFIPRRNEKTIDDLIDEDREERFKKYKQDFISAMDDWDDLDEDERRTLNEHAAMYALQRLRYDRLKKLCSPHLLQALAEYHKNPYPMEFRFMPAKYINEYNNSVSSIFSRRTKVNIKKSDRRYAKDISALLRRTSTMLADDDPSTYTTAAFLESKFIPFKYYDFGIPYMGSTGNKWDAVLHEMQVDYALMDMHPADSANETIHRRDMKKIINYLEEKGVNTTDLARVYYGLGEYESPSHTNREARQRRTSNRKNEKKVLEKLIGITKDKRIQKVLARNEQALADQQDHITRHDIDPY